VKHRKLLLGVVVFSLVTTVVRSNEPPAEVLDYATLTRIRDEGLARSQVMDHAGWLSDVYGPRLTGSPAISQAADWAARKFSEWDLQNIHREAFPFGKGWTLVRFSAHLIEPQIQPLIGYPKTWTPGTNGPVTADVVQVSLRTEADFERYRGQLRGKVVLVQPAREVALLEGTVVGRWTEDLLREAERTPFSTTDPFLHAQAPSPPQSRATFQQSLEQFLLNEGVVAALDRGSDSYMVRGDNQMAWMTQRTDGGTVFVGHGGPRDESAGKGLPAITLAVEHYNRMVRILEKRVPVRIELNVVTEFHDEDPGAGNGFNLLAEIPGSDLAEEVVLLGAHLDSYPWATGATDNAGGVAVMMEAMRILQAVGVKPRRTIRLGLWGAEEEGLLGSRAYVAAHLVDPDTGGVKPEYEQLSAYYNIDNGTGRIHGVWLQGNFAVEPIFREWFEPLRDLGVSTIAPRSVRGSDYASFDNVGIPAFQFMQDRLEYNSRTHHSNMDFYDRLQRDDLMQMAVVVATFAYNTARRDEKLPRKPPPPGAVRSFSAGSSAEPRFEPVQPELFGLAGGQPNAWADFDGDKDLDLFVGFRGAPNRLYRNDTGRFVEVASQLAVADPTDTRAAGWGDFDGDGDLDLYVGFSRRSNVPNKLYRNEGAGRAFTEVGEAAGVATKGESRQISWIDVDTDGDLDLFLALRDAPNALFRNDGGHFTNVAAEMGLADERPTVGAVWFDFDQDGDLDLYVANQDGKLNGLFRNDGPRFVDVAGQLEVDGAGKPRAGSNGPSVVDYDNDGDLDLFVANYGPNFLFRNDGGRFAEVAADVGLAGGERATPSNWGDYDNDGRPDLYVSSYVDRPPNGRDYLYHSDGTGFSEVTPMNILEHPASHGIQWVDFDGDGDLDLALADNNPPGTHYLYRNLLKPEQARRSLQVLVLDAQGRYVRQGSEVRVYAAGSRKILGTRLVDTGSGYCSQNAMPVHIGLPTDAPVDVEVTTLTPSGRRVTRLTKVSPTALAGKPLVVKIGSDGPVTSTGRSGSADGAAGTGAQAPARADGRSPAHS